MNIRTLRFLPLFVTVFLDFLGIALVVPIFAPMLIDPLPGMDILPASATIATRGIILGFLTATYPFGQFLGSPILGKLSDRHGRKFWLVLSLGGSAVGYVLSAAGVLVSSVALLFVGRFVCGFMGGNGSICQSSVADLYDEKRKGAYFGLLALAMGLGFILGPVVGGRLADPDIVSWFNYDTPFWVSAIAAGLNTLLMLFFFSETIAKKRKVKIRVWTGFVDIYRAFREPSLRAIIGVFFLFTLGWFFFAQFFQVYLIQEFHFTQTKIGDTFTYIALWYAVMQGTVSPPLSRVLRPRPIVIVALPLMGLTLFSLLIPTNEIAFWFIYPFLVLFVCLAWPNILALVSNCAGPERQGEVMGVNQSIQSLAQALTPILSGPMVANFERLPTIIAGTSCFLAWVLLFLVGPSIANSKRSAPHSESSAPSPPPQSQD
jgi:MFS transporter, DHA1 family, tetracycline resistance protein